MFSLAWQMDREGSRSLGGMSEVCLHPSWMNDVIRLLKAAKHGEHLAAEQLFSVVFGELHRMAEKTLSGDPGHDTPHPTALFHDAWLNLVGDRGSIGFANRVHFFGATAQAM